MTALILTYHLKDEATRVAFYHALIDNNIQALTQKEDGCVKYDYYLPCHCASDLLLVEIWESPAHQTAHTQQAHFAKTQALKAQFGVTMDCESFSR
ncbi:MAG: antibiotic biosynthesis monooxygenase [Clostridia bacterium]|nr:antibiotic biosynthesis monooxygenase [Clostridia bacterium]